MKAIILAIVTFSPSLGYGLELQLPLDCELGTSCIIQQYVDHDPSGGARDYRCGSQSYDGHNGTDFRLFSLKSMRTGVRVLASAAGRVLRTRDGMIDKLQGAEFDKDIEARGVRERNRDFTR